MYSPVEHLDRLYADHEPVLQLRAKAMFWIYALATLAVSVIFMFDMLDPPNDPLLLGTAYSALLACLVTGVGLLLRGRDQAATHVVIAALVVFCGATLTVALDGRPDAFFNGWSKWFPVFVVMHGLFLSEAGAMAVALGSIVWGVLFYVVFSPVVADTPYAIIPSDLVDLVAVQAVLGTATVGIVRFVRQAVRTAERALVREQRLNAELESKVAERTRQVKEGFRQRQVVIDYMADGILLLDQDGMIRLMNQQLRDLLDLDDSRTLAPAKAVLPPSIWAEVGGALAALEPADAVCDLGDGQFIKVSVNPVPFGEGTGVVMLARDVSLEREVDRLKTEFISTVSHELRTPLTSVLGFSKMIRSRLEKRVQPALDTSDTRAVTAMDKVLSNLDIVVSEGTRLTELINDVLDVAKMEAGRVEWRRDPVEVAALVNQAAAAVRGLFPKARGVRLVVELDVGDAVVTGDEARLLQVLVNLLSNASKFTEAGAVTLAATREAAEVVFEVRDTGRGVPAEQQAKIFDRFRQVEDTLTDKPQGTGLGLPICKQVVEAHDSCIELSSVLGEGSTFRFRLPVAERGEG